MQLDLFGPSIRELVPQGAKAIPVVDGMPVGGKWGNAGVAYGDEMFTFRMPESPPDACYAELSDVIDLSNAGDDNRQHAANMLHRLQKYGRADNEFCRLLEKHAAGQEPGPNGWGKSDQDVL